MSFRQSPLQKNNLEQEVQHSLPCWESSDTGLLGMIGIPVYWTSAGNKIDVSSLMEQDTSLPNVTTDPEEKNNRGSEIRNEESLGITNVNTNW